MVSAATRRKRRQRGDLIALEIEDGAAEAAIERKVLGTEVTLKTPDASIFSLDRAGESKVAIAKKYRAQAVADRLAAKRERRAKPRPRRSEMTSLSQTDLTSAIPLDAVRGRKKKTVGFSSVDMEILRKREFDKPEGHVGNVSAARREAKRFITGKEDLWTSEMAKTVEQEITDDRKKMVTKVNRRLRRATAVICPDTGMSVNPTFEQHQNKLGEALAKVIREEDNEEWDEKKMAFDPSLLEESTEGEVADTGMKVDDADSEADAEQPEVVTETELVSRSVPERKTRADRNKEARKRELRSNIAKKRANERRAKDFMNLEAIAAQATKEADKINGKERRQKRKDYVPIPNKNRDRPVLPEIAGRRLRSETHKEPVSLSTDLSDSLRSIKTPEVNPMVHDRLLSFERRGMLEPPKVISTEVWRMKQAARQEELKDRRKRKGRGANSKLTFWKNGKRVIL